MFGIDNIVFISILAGKLPPEQQAKARYIGLGLALVMRVILLFSLTWVIDLIAKARQQVNDISDVGSS